MKPLLKTKLKVEACPFSRIPIPPGQRLIKDILFSPEAPALKTAKHQIEKFE